MPISAEDLNQFYTHKSYQIPIFIFVCALYVPLLLFVLHQSALPAKASVAFLNASAFTSERVSEQASPSVTRIGVVHE